MSSIPLHMLDTNTVSYFLKGRSASVGLKIGSAAMVGRIVISTITEAELLFGLERKPLATRSRATFDRFLDRVQILPWDSEAARSYGRLRATINAAGKSLATMDMLIAAHAMASDAILVSHDKAFHQLSPMLQVVDWADDL